MWLFWGLNKLLHIKNLNKWILKVSWVYNNVIIILWNFEDTESRYIFISRGTDYLFLESSKR